MLCNKIFKELNKNSHDRLSFDCGEEELNYFIKNHAAKHMKAGISRTMVLPAKDILANQKHLICSFFTVSPNTISRETLPVNHAKKLPLYPVPVFLIAQLAVHKECHGYGLGKITLIKALEYLWKANAYLPAYAVIVDCLNESSQSFYTKYGFEKLCDHNQKIRMYIPIKTLDTLFS
ncbi:GNAT family N-acetyltransferase [Desulfobotulus mexicanus]|uniref:GNAT family N-acetyltransferase n=1 Tax=Desulfobotulus mexicanus TaxID=2586642 RepID=A0A5Q4VIK2_9BACT|nr:GNAT family N-acetyltransferase [Desulfobotulus mexicanus]TYT76072.1 GNAT family N-acetyltransferase [Desulfobotulus mexicanus]